MPLPSNNQTWLILSHAFNMDGRAASQTITDKIPHLLDLGIKPIVVSGVLGRQDHLIEHRQVLPALPVGLRFDLRHFLRNRIENRFLYRLSILSITLALLPFYLLEKLIIPIETTWSWSISAYIVASGLIKKRRPTVIFSVGSAYAAHIAGYWLSKRYGIPWIVEIHDPMLLKSQPIKSRRKKFLLWLEGIICTHADVVWWFTEKALERARERHPQLGDRGHYVIAGVDAPDFNRVPYKRSTHLVIAHFGSLSMNRNLKDFLLALQKFLKIHPDALKHLRLHLYGGSMDAISAHALKSFVFPEIIHDFGRLETDPVTGESGRLQVLKRMHAADCLLLLHGMDAFCEEYIPSKLFEYLWTQRPILGLVHCNPQLTGILHELDHWAIDALDVDAIALALEELYQRWTKDDLQDSRLVSPYTTRRAVQHIYSWTTDMLNKQHGNKLNE